MFRAQKHITSTANSNSNVRLLSRQELGQLQAHLWRMYKDIEAICIRHNLQMCLAAGNVLGAVRHNGWIPWDDDLDVCMPREDYDKFMNIYSKELPDKYIAYSVENENGPIIRFGKIIDRETEFSQLIDLYPAHKEGVFIDVFPYDNVPRSKFEHKLRQMLAYGIMMIQNSVNQRKNATKEYASVLCSSHGGKNVYRIREMLGFLFGVVSLKTWFKLHDRLIRNCEKTGLLYCGASTTTGWIPIPESYLFPAKKVTLANGEDCLLPGEPEKYLDHVYGNWRTIPDDTDKWHHYVKEFKLPGTN